MAGIWAAAGQVWPAFVLVTGLLLVGVVAEQDGLFAAQIDERAPARLGAGIVAVVLSTVLVLTLTAPALPVLAVGVAAVLVDRVGLARIHEIVDARVLTGLFVVAVVLGAVGRWWNGPTRLLDHVGRVGTALGGAAAAVCANNFPAAVLLTPHAPAHPRALLIGLNLGPNLAVTGSLSAYLWLRVARSLDARPSLRVYSSVGVVLVPLSLGGALGALWLVAPGRL